MTHHFVQKHYRPLPFTAVDTNMVWLDSMVVCNMVCLWGGGLQYLLPPTPCHNPFRFAVVAAIAFDFANTPTPPSGETDSIALTHLLREHPPRSFSSASSGDDAF